MLTLPRIKLLLAATLFISLLLVLGATLDRPDLTVLAQREDQREFVDEIPRHVPLRAKVKKEKEKEFKDLKNDVYLSDKQFLCQHQ